MILAGLPTNVKYILTFLDSWLSVLCYRFILVSVAHKDWVWNTQHFTNHGGPPFIMVVRSGCCLLSTTFVIPVLPRKFDNIRVCSDIYIEAISNSNCFVDSEQIDSPHKANHVLLLSTAN